MPKTDRLAGLKPDEYDLTHDRYHCDLAHVALKKQRDLLQERLAACRVLLERIDKNTGSDGWVLLSAEDLAEIHKILKGTEGGK